MNVPRPEADDGLRRGGLHAFARRGCPARRLGEHAQDRGFIQPELAVACPDSQHDLLGRDVVAVVQRLDLDLIQVCLGQHVREQVLGLLDAAQDRLPPGEHLHRDERVEPFALQDRRGSRKVDVRRIPGQDLVGWASSKDAHHGSGAFAGLACVKVTAPLDDPGCGEVTACRDDTGCRDVTVLSLLPAPMRRAPDPFSPGRDPSRVPGRAAV